MIEVAEGVKTKEELTEWVVGQVTQWEIFRDTEHLERWDEYYRLWRGLWSAKDRQRLRERSKAIMPALQQALEMAVAEMDEAVFGRQRWFDIADDVMDLEAEDMMFQAMLLREDFELAGVPRNVSQTFLLSALYGTGIAKIAVERGRKAGRVQVKLHPIDPREFAIDPAAHTVDQALGCAHVTFVPNHIVLAKQQEGIYRDVDPGTLDDATAGNPNPAPQNGQGFTDSEKVEIVEYHGKVPAKFLEGVNPEFETLKSMDEEENYVEAIVTIGNRDTLLRAVENPFKSHDRGIIAFPYDDVPNSFWGRGVMERGYWPQKVLDTEVRARIESLAYSTFPMMGINATAIPRGERFEVRPGKNVFFNSEPGNAITPIQFPPPDPQTYQQSTEMERMIQTATGQNQPPAEMNLTNAPAAGIAMLQGGVLKRTKRTMMNVERLFLTPLVSKSLLRYQEFDRRYPKGDMRFTVIGTLGMMQRELEIGQMTQILNAVPAQSPAFWALLGQVVDLMSITKKEDVKQVINFVLQQSMEPQEPEAPDLSDQARMLSAQARVEQMAWERERDQQQLELDQSKTLVDAKRVQNEWERMTGEMVSREAQVAADQVKKETESILNVAKAEAEEAGSQIAQYQAIVQSLGDTALQQAQASPGPTSDEIAEKVARIMLANKTPQEGIQIERDPASQLVTSVNGRPVQRNDQNLIVGVE